MRCGSLTMEGEVDNSTFYLGSANLDWRSLTQVKELGIVVEDSHCLSRDLLQLFDFDL